MKLAVKKILGVLLLLIFGGVALSSLFVITEKDKKKWEQLKKKTTQEQKPAFFSIEKKESVREFFQDGRYLIIQAENSEFFVQKDKEIKIEELLHKVYVILQEECYYVDELGKKTKEKKNAMQKVRVCQADKAFLNLNTKILTATEVELQSYLLPGHVLPKTFPAPFLEAEADKITLFLNQGRLECEKFSSHFQLSELFQ